MKEKNLISIIVPVYNSAAYLPACLESLRAQTYEDLEIILINDGSTDESGAVLAAFQKEDPRVRLLTQENQGPSAARNAGLRAASGKWILFADSDDSLGKDCCRTVLQLALANSADLVLFGGVSVIEKTGSTKKLKTGLSEGMHTKEEMLAALADYSVIPNVFGKLFRRELFSGITFPEGEQWEDCAIMFRLADRASRIFVTHASLYRYLRRPGSLTRKAQKDLSIYKWRYLQYGRQYAFLKEKYPGIAKKMDVLWAETCLKYCAVLAADPEKRSDYKNLRAVILQRSPAGKRPAPSFEDASLKMRLSRGMLCYTPHLFLGMSRLLVPRKKKRNPW